MNATTETAWAVRWLAATGAAGPFNGSPIRAWGKDTDGYLVAVRTDQGIFPVQNIGAVLAHRKGEGNG